MTRDPSSACVCTGNREVWTMESSKSQKLKEPFLPPF